jgi:hypothetical protein
VFKTKKGERGGKNSVYTPDFKVLVERVWLLVNEDSLVRIPQSEAAQPEKNFNEQQNDRRLPMSSY